ncbi:MAG: hypothetical protein ACRCWU_00380 [Metamycoplasmataceae bacterium]
MSQDIKDEYKKIFTKFVSICNENKLWYSLANDTLLSYKTNNDYFINSGILEIFMTKESYTLLQKNYPNHVIDFSYSDRFFLATPFFYIRESNWFIKIIIIVPTKIEKIKKFNTLKNKIKFNYSNFLTFQNGYSKGTKFIFALFRLISKFCKPIEMNEFYDSLFSEDYQGFFTINSLNEHSVKNWFPNITFIVEDITFLEIEAKIMKESNFFLNARYGDKWGNGVQIKTKHFDYQKFSKNLNN